MPRKICRFCEKVFYAKSEGKKYCSANCSEKFRMQKNVFKEKPTKLKPNHITKKCFRCGIWMVMPEKDRCRIHYCEKCRQKQCSIV